MTRSLSIDARLVASVLVGGFMLFQERLGKVAGLGKFAFQLGDPADRHSFCGR